VCRARSRVCRPANERPASPSGGARANGREGQGCGRGDRHLAPPRLSVARVGACERTRHAASPGRPGRGRPGMSEAPKLLEHAARAPDAPPPRSDQQLSDFVGPGYRRLRRIGSGGMADVYEVEHVRLGSHFAAKILRPGRAGWEGAVRRFLREARLLARLKSDHLVGVVDVSSDEHDPPFYVMELLDGQDVRALLQSGAEIPVSRALKIATDA